MAASLIKTLVIIASLVGVAASVRADVPLVAKTAEFGRSNDQLTVSVGFRELFDPALREHLRNGFATTVVMHVYIYEEKRDRPIAVQIRSLRAVYDLWEETFTLLVEDAQGKKSSVYKTEQDIVDRLTSLWKFPLISTTLLTAQKNYFVAVLAEVNPLDKETLAQIRRWLRKPTRQTGVGSENLFGSFVSIFLNDNVPRGERFFRVRTQDFSAVQP